ncbi:MAG TPA: rod shape-determining protein MreD [Anaerolineae bacterium]|jgi:rod shape-determining protein MreD|nr:rod shape-determining protein MreD [Anaerolineae bacterium]
MTIYLVVPLLLATALVQSTIVAHVDVWGVFPDLPLLWVVSWSLLRGARQGIVWGFIGGVALDLFSGAPFGAATLSMMAAGFLSGLAEPTVFRSHLALPLVAAFVATLVFDLVFLAVIRLSGGTVVWGDTLLRLVLPAAALNTVVIPVIFVVTRWLSKRFSGGQIEY